MCASPLVKHALLMGQDKRELVSGQASLVRCSPFLQVAEALTAASLMELPFAAPRVFPTLAARLRALRPIKSPD